MPMPTLIWRVAAERGSRLREAAVEREILDDPQLVEVSVLDLAGEGRQPVGRPLPAKHHAERGHGAVTAVARCRCASQLSDALPRRRAIEAQGPQRHRAKALATSQVDAFAGAFGVDVVDLTSLGAGGGAVGDFQLIGERRFSRHRIAHRRCGPFGDQLVDVPLAHAGLTLFARWTCTHRSDRPVVSVQPNTERQLAVVADGLLGRVDRPFDEGQRGDRSGLARRVVVGHDADLIDVRRHAAVVVHPVPALVGALRVVDVGHADRQGSPVGMQPAAELADEADPRRPCRGPGRPVVGERELLVVDVDTVEAVGRRQIGDGGDVCGPRSRVGQYGRHATSGHCVDDRRHDTSSRRRGPRRRMPSVVSAERLPSTRDGGRVVRGVPERRHLAHHRTVGCKGRLGVGQHPIGRPGIDRDVDGRWRERIAARRCHSHAGQPEGQHACSNRPPAPPRRSTHEVVDVKIGQRVDATEMTRRRHIDDVRDDDDLAPCRRGRPNTGRGVFEGNAVAGRH